MSNACPSELWAVHLGERLRGLREVTEQLAAVEKMTGMDSQVFVVDGGTSFEPPGWCVRTAEEIASRFVVSRDANQPVFGCRCRAGRGCAWGTVFAQRMPVLLVVVGPLRVHAPAASPRLGAGRGAKAAITKHDALRLLLHSVCQELSRIATAVLFHGEQGQHPLVEAAMNVGRRRFGDKAFGSEAAALATGYSRGYFCEMFHRETGLTYGHWLKRFRVERALELLADPACKVISAARECGFGSVWTFDRACREYHGHAPRGRHPKAPPPPA